MSGHETVRAVLVGDDLYRRLPDGTLVPMPAGQTDWERVAAMTDGEIEAIAGSDLDAPPMSEEQWAQAPGIAASREIVTIELDRDSVDWFRRQGARPETGMSAVLRRYVAAQRRKTG